jgi:hypothetical protein
MRTWKLSIISSPPLILPFNPQLAGRLTGWAGQAGDQAPALKPPPIWRRGRPGGELQRLFQPFSPFRFPGASGGRPTPHLQLRLLGWRGGEECQLEGLSVQVAEPTLYFLCPCLVMSSIRHPMFGRFRLRSLRIARPRKAGGGSACRKPATCGCCCCCCCCV